MLKLRFLSSLLALLTLLQPIRALAKDKEPPVKPTFAKDAAAKVARGNEVKITLQAVPSFGHVISFKIQTPPLHGTLSEPQFAGDHSAFVFYRHDGSKSPLTDEFFFRAQANGQSVSVASHCTITIVSPPALLSLDPPLIDFGECMLAEKQHRKVTITNLGGSRATGKLLLPDGFSAPQGERYNLGEGESKTMVLEFDPMEEKKYAGEAGTQPLCEKAPLQLCGVGKVRFELTQQSPSEWEVKNLTEQPLRVSFKGGAGWSLPSETSIPPHELSHFAFQQSVQRSSVNRPESNI